MTVGATGNLNEEQNAVLAHADSLCLSAGAGSGKTKTLVEKYVQLLTMEGRQPSEILAITFTEKAAAEMQIRIRSRLQEICRGETDLERCAELEDKLMNLSGGWISTIHAFGARVLREHPAEAGVDPGFAPLPEQESKILWEESLTAAILEMSESDPSIGEMTIRMGLGGKFGLADLLDDIKSQLESHGRLPTELVAPDPPAGLIDPSELKDALNALIRVENPGKSLQSRIPVLAELFRTLSSGDLAAKNILRALSRAGWDEKNTRLKPGGSLKSSEKELYAIVESAGRSLAEKAARIFESETAATLIRILSRAWQNAEKAKARRRALDFSDLELKTLRLFESHPESVIHYQDRFKHILIDEYQDVNPVQARIVRILAGARPQSLFAVGDPKQSIYRFRGADIEQFMGLWSEMEERQAAFHLKSNYRSHPNLVRAVNAIFDNIIFKGHPPVMMNPITENRKSIERPLIHWLSFDLGDVSAEERRELEALHIAQHIRRLTGPVDDAVNPTGRQFKIGDITLLFRATGSLFLYEEAMRRAGIPYELVKAGTAFRSQEALDLLNAVSAVVRPYDPVAWLGFLRSPLSGLSDDALWILSESGNLRDTILSESPLPDRLSAADRRAAEFSRTLVRRAAELRKTLTPLAFIDWLIGETGHRSILAALDQAESRLRHLEAIRSLAAQYDHHRPDPFSAFLEAAWRMVDRKERDSSADVSAEDRVKLMTIHQAKGLEFPVVILPDLLRSDPRGTPDALVISESGRPTLAMRLKLAGAAEKFPTARWETARTVSSDAETQEQKRLLYVAMTRPIDLLILPGPDSPVRGQSVWELMYDFLHDNPEHVERIAVPATAATTGTAARISLQDCLTGVRFIKPTITEVQRKYEIRNVTSIDRVVARTGDRGGDGAALKVGRRSSSAEYATLLGTLAHETLQNLDLSLNPDDCVKEAEDFLDRRFDWIAIPDKLKETLKADVGRFCRSDFFQRLRDQRAHVRREHPFLMNISVAGGKPVWVSGKVDVMILSEPLIEIYDYKYSEAGEGFGEYETQLMAYALAACRAYGRTHAKIGLQFLTKTQQVRSGTVTKEAAENYLTALLQKSLDTGRDRVGDLLLKP